MALEEEYNMLNKRVHFQNPMFASLDFLGYVEYESGERGLPHRYTGWCYNYVEGNRGIYRFGDREITVEPGSGLLIPPFLPHHLVNPGPGNMQLIYMGFSFGGGTAPVDGDDILKINETLRNPAIPRRFMKSSTACSARCGLPDEREKRNCWPDSGS